MAQRPYCAVLSQGVHTVLVDDQHLVTDLYARDHPAAISLTAGAHKVYVKV